MNRNGKFNGTGRRGAQAHYKSLRNQGHTVTEDERLLEQLGEVPVALIEKGRTPGSHLMSGAMMHPSAMKRLFPDLPECDW